jgi:hypothetical protein
MTNLEDVFRVSAEVSKRQPECCADNLTRRQCYKLPLICRYLAYDANLGGREEGLNIVSVNTTPFLPRTEDDSRSDAQQIFLLLASKDMMTKMIIFRDVTPYLCMYPGRQSLGSFTRIIIKHASAWTLTYL